MKHQEERDRAIGINLLRRGVAIDIIDPCTGLSIEEVQQLQQQEPQYSNYDRLQ